MKRILIVFIISMVSTVLLAQVPYFGTTPGAEKLYGYTSVKFRPGINNTETYNTFQYGLTDFASAGIDFYTSSSSVYMGFMARAGYKVNQLFSIGCTLTPSFDVNNNFEFSYFTGGLFMNGAITRDAHLFWCSNTWLGLNKNDSNTLNQFTYLGYEISIKNIDAITPMIGLEHSWKFDRNPDIAAGFYYTHKMWNFYIWGNDFCKSYPRIVVGIDFKL